MRNLIALLSLILGCAALHLNAADAPPIYATIETSLTTASPQIRMFALDADPNSYFASEKNAAADDHFTLVFDKPVTLKSLNITTGRVNNADTIENGILEFSEDGKVFIEAAKFSDGALKLDNIAKKVSALRIKPAADLTHPLAIREFTIVADPPVVPYKYPVEVFVDTTDAPDMHEWTVKVARICERAYQMICEELKTDGFVPKTVVTMTMRNDYKGVAEASGSRIKGSAKFFKDRPKDVGAMVHEMVHVAQQYRSRNNPSWLVEGVADYIRNYLYEPGTLRPLPTKYAYNNSYQISARFLVFCMEKYDKDIIKKLNRIMREGKYTDETFKELTQKTLPELDEEWKASAKPKA